MSEPLDPPEEFLTAVARGEYAEISPTFGTLKHPELTQALINAERAGFLRGLGVAARVCRDRQAHCEDPENPLRRQRYWRDAFDERGAELRLVAARIEARDGRDGEAVREHCAQFAWSEEEAGAEQPATPPQDGHRTAPPDAPGAGASEDGGSADGAQERTVTR